MIRYFKDTFKFYFQGGNSISLLNTIALRTKLYSFNILVFLQLVLFIICVYIIIIYFLVDSIILCDSLTVEELKSILSLDTVKYNEASTQYQYYMDLFKEERSRPHLKEDSLIYV